MGRGVWVPDQARDDSGTFGDALHPNPNCRPPRKRRTQYAAAYLFYHRRLWNTGSSGQAGRRQL